MEYRYDTQLLIEGRSLDEAHAKGVQFTVAYRLLGHHVIAVQERQTAVIQKIPQVVAIHVKARDACAAREFRDDLGRRAG